jgi:hypothetical protein
MKMFILVSIKNFFLKFIFSITYFANAPVLPRIGQGTGPGGKPRLFQTKFQNNKANRMKIGKNSAIMFKLKKHYLVLVLFTCAK